jgi:hypothetical protein
MGEQPSTFTNGKGVALSQMVINPLHPALGTWFTVTVTVAVEVVHGAAPATLYV